MQRIMQATVVMTAGLFFAASASADLLLYEPFDYASGPITGLSGGSGDWTDGWSGSSYAVTASSLTLPNMPFAVSGGHIAGTSTTNRNFTTIDTSVAQTLYMSYLVKRTGFNPTGTSGQWADAHLRGGSTGFVQVMRGTTTSSQTHGIIAQGGTTDVGGDANSENPYFFVIKIVLNNGSPDEMYANVYSDGADIPAGEPVSWQYAITNANVTDNVGKVTFWSGTLSGFAAYFDEYRLATTYGEAVPVPEPAALGLLGAGGLLMLYRRG
ncbi:MAG: PEP-CTERM sorting domain-containing protein [Phycisphaeraceae bacterium]|nr:PEP-CTERM sorting domain-containing protein [Phycisphaeraceae bacterium]